MFIAKMTVHDWLFVVTYFMFLIPVALFFDVFLNLIRGQYILISGIFICGYLVYNRIDLREKAV